MTKPRALLAMVILASGILLAWQLIRGSKFDGSGINAANFNRIQAGMPAHQVNRILGCPPGDYRSEPGGFELIGPSHIPWTEHARGGKLEVWYITRYHIEVLFDRHGRVVGKYWHDNNLNTGKGDLNTGRPTSE